MTHLLLNFQTLNYEKKYFEEFLTEMRRYLKLHF